ncbi:MAG: autotransporter outer membrane beta-barrel domain-containing protein [Treponema sp.]|nr:autotransporter outer membrane beta-barrel domain-containing protein [Treponema sp.]
MKKKILGAFLAAFLSVSSFAQETVPNAIFVDFGSTIIAALAGGFGIGLGYERGLTNNFSTLINASYIGFTVKDSTQDTKFLGASAGLHARYYPLSGAVKRWFIDVGGNYSYIAITYGDKVDSHIFEVGALTGWKFVFGGGFFLEPGVGYRFIFGDVNTPAGSASVAPTSGVTWRFGMGWAF